MLDSLNANTRAHPASLRDALAHADQHPLLGVASYFPRDNVRALAHVGYDFVLLDWEDTTPSHVRALRDAGGVSLVRVPTVQHVKRAMDAGANGIIVPASSISDAESALNAVSGPVSPTSMRPALLVQLDSPASATLAPSLLALSGIDGAFAALDQLFTCISSVPRAEIEAIFNLTEAAFIAASDKAGKPLMWYARTADAVSKRLKQGYRAVVTGIDADLVEGAAEAAKTHEFELACRGSLAEAAAEVDRWREAEGLDAPRRMVGQREAVGNAPQTNGATKTQEPKSYAMWADTSETSQSDRYSAYAGDAALPSSGTRAVTGDAQSRAMREIVLVSSPSATATAGEPQEKVHRYHIHRHIHHGNGAELSTESVSVAEGPVSQRACTCATCVARRENNLHQQEHVGVEHAADLERPPELRRFMAEGFDAEGDFVIAEGESVQPRQPVNLAEGGRKERGERGFGSDSSTETRVDTPEPRHEHGIPTAPGMFDRSDIVDINDTNLAGAGDAERTTKPSTLGPFDRPAKLHPVHHQLTPRLESVERTEYITPGDVVDIQRAEYVTPNSHQTVMERREVVDSNTERHTNARETLDGGNSAPIPPVHSSKERHPNALSAFEPTSFDVDRDRQRRIDDISHRESGKLAADRKGHHYEREAKDTWAAHRGREEIRRESERESRDKLEHEREHGAGLTFVNHGGTTTTGRRGSDKEERWYTEEPDLDRIRYVEDGHVPVNAEGGVKGEMKDKWAKGKADVKHLFARPYKGMDSLEEAPPSTRLARETGQPEVAPVGGQAQFIAGDETIHSPTADARGALHTTTAKGSTRNAEPREGLSGTHHQVEAGHHGHGTHAHSEVRDGAPYVSPGTNTQGNDGMYARAKADTGEMYDRARADVRHLDEQPYRGMDSLNEPPPSERPPDRWDAVRQAPVETDEVEHTHRRRTVTRKTKKSRTLDTTYDAEHDARDLDKHRRSQEHERERELRQSQESERPATKDRRNSMNKFLGLFRKDKSKPKKKASASSTEEYEVLDVTNRGEVSPQSPKQAPPLSPAQVLKDEVQHGKHRHSGTASTATGVTGTRQPRSRTDPGGATVRDDSQRNVLANKEFIGPSHHRRGQGDTLVREEVVTMDGRNTTVTEGLMRSGPAGTLVEAESRRTDAVGDSTTTGELLQTDRHGNSFIAEEQVQTDARGNTRATGETLATNARGGQMDERFAQTSGGGRTETATGIRATDGRDSLVAEEVRGTDTRGEAVDARFAQANTNGRTDTATWVRQSDGLGDTLTAGEAREVTAQGDEIEERFVDARSSPIPHTVPAHNDPTTHRMPGTYTEEFTTNAPLPPPRTAVASSPLRQEIGNNRPSGDTPLEMNEALDVSAARGNTKPKSKRVSVRKVSNGGPWPRRTPGSDERTGWPHAAKGNGNEQPRFDVVSSSADHLVRAPDAHTAAAAAVQYDAARAELDRVELERIMALPGIDLNSSPRDRIERARGDVVERHDRVAGGGRRMSLSKNKKDKKKKKDAADKDRRPSVEVIASRPRPLQPGDQVDEIQTFVVDEDTVHIPGQPPRTTIRKYMVNEEVGRPARAYAVTEEQWTEANRAAIRRSPRHSTSDSHPRRRTSGDTRTSRGSRREGTEGYGVAQVVPAVSPRTSVANPGPAPDLAPEEIEEQFRIADHLQHIQRPPLTQTCSSEILRANRLMSSSPNVPFGVY